jgi:hypothetical protein
MAIKAKDNNGLAILVSTDCNRTFSLTAGYLRTASRMKGTAHHDDILHRELDERRGASLLH